MNAFTERLFKQARRVVNTKGAAVAFSVVGEGDYNDETDEFEPPVNSSVPGLAVEVPGDPEEYERLGLIKANPVTLIFVPDTIGQAPPLHSHVSWAGTRRIVQSVLPYRPAGVVAAARVVLT